MKQVNTYKRNLNKAILITKLLKKTHPGKDFSVLDLVNTIEKIEALKIHADMDRAEITCIVEKILNEAFTKKNTRIMNDIYNESLNSIAPDYCKARETLPRELMLANGGLINE
jgi:hypothetical protein